MSYKIKTDMFEGPLDLLVYLIENAKMDIYDIEISEITGQYIEYIKQMQNLDVEIGAEFILLAANLLKIKSKLLLPGNNKEESLKEDDPRREIVDMLMEYKKFKNVAEYLKKREGEGLQLIAKPKADLEEILSDPTEILKLSHEEFIKAFEKFILKKQKVMDIKKRYDNIQRKRITAEERIGYIKKLLLEMIDDQQEIDFIETLKDEKDRYDKALSFTSVLEMIKQGQVVASQETTYGNIKLSRGCKLSKASMSEEDETFTL